MLIINYQQQDVPSLSKAFILRYNGVGAVGEGRIVAAVLAVVLCNNEERPCGEEGQESKITSFPTSAA